MKRKIESWQSLVQVCRRWRGLVFESPRRLNLQLCCTPGRFARASLNVWPALPLLIKGVVNEASVAVDNAIAELEHRDRIYQIDLVFSTTWQIKVFWIAMQVPFPQLALLRLSVQAFKPYRTYQFFPTHSWVDLRHVCDTSTWLPFHFRDCRNCFCLPLALSPFGSLIFLIPRTFHPRRWPLASLC